MKIVTSSDKFNLILSPWDDFSLFIRSPVLLGTLSAFVVKCVMGVIIINQIVSYHRVIPPCTPSSYTKKTPWSIEILVRAKWSKELFPQFLNDNKSIQWISKSFRWGNRRKNKAKVEVNWKTRTHLNSAHVWPFFYSISSSDKLHFLLQPLVCRSFSKRCWWEKEQRG